MRTASTVRVDSRKNRIYLTMVGFHDLAEATRVRALYLEAIAQCAPGFTVLVDVTEYKPGGAAAQASHAEAARAAEQAGVRRVARVVGDTPLGGMQIDRIVRGEAQYEAQNFATLDEAEAFLDAADSE